MNIYLKMQEKRQELLAKTQSLLLVLAVLGKLELLQMENMHLISR